MYCAALYVRAVLQLQNSTEAPVTLRFVRVPDLDASLAVVGGRCLKVPGGSACADILRLPAADRRFQEDAGCLRAYRGLTVLGASCLRVRYAADVFRHLL